VRENQRKWRERHREEILEKGRIWRAANREKKREHDRKYRENHRETKREKDRMYRVRNRERTRGYQREYQKAWRLKNIEKVSEGNKRYRELNGEKKKAQRRVRDAVGRGEIERERCEVCGEGKAQGHHRDYEKPLEVVWLCAICHKLVHRLLNNLERIMGQKQGVGYGAGLTLP
jgi:hypothetical protein